jgi:hypothetical protein
MNKTIKLSNGKILDLTKDDLTIQDIRESSGVEVRCVRKLQEEILIEKIVKNQKNKLISN